MDLYYDVEIAEDLREQLVELGDLFGTEIPHRSKNRLVLSMVQEARIQSFLHCHTVFKALLESIFVLSGLFLTPYEFNSSLN